MSSILRGGIKRSFASNQPIFFKWRLLSSKLCKQHEASTWKASRFLLRSNARRHALLPGNKQEAEMQRCRGLVQGCGIPTRGSASPRLFFEEKLPFAWQESRWHLGRLGCQSSMPHAALFDQTLSPGHLQAGSGGVHRQFRSLSCGARHHRLQQSSGT